MKLFIVVPIKTSKIRLISSIAILTAATLLVTLSICKLQLYALKRITSILMIECKMPLFPVILSTIY